MSNRTRQFAASAASAYAEANADQGFGSLGPWPFDNANNGFGQDHSFEGSFVRDMIVREIDFKIRAENKQEMKVPGLTVQFIYEVNHNNEMKAVKGNPMRIAYDLSGIPDNQQINFKTNAGRLKGFGKAFFDEDIDDMGQLLDRLEARFKEAKEKGYTIVGTVDLKYSSYKDRNGKDRIDKRDYLIDVAAA